MVVKREVHELNWSRSAALGSVAISRESRARMMVQVIMVRRVLVRRFGQKR